MATLQDLQTAISRARNAVARKNGNGSASFSSRPAASTASIPLNVVDTSTLTLTPMETFALKVASFQVSPKNICGIDLMNQPLTLNQAIALSQLVADQQISDDVLVAYNYLTTGTDGGADPNVVNSVRSILDIIKSLGGGQGGTLRNLFNTVRNNPNFGVLSNWFPI